MIEASWCTCQIERRTGPAAAEAGMGDSAILSHPGPSEGVGGGANKTQLTTMYIGKVFWGLKSSSLHSTGNTRCFHISTAISSSTSVGICGGERRAGMRWARLGLATFPSLARPSPALFKLPWAPSLSTPRDTPLTSGLHF